MATERHSKVREVSSGELENKAPQALPTRSFAKIIVKERIRFPLALPRPHLGRAPETLQRNGLSEVRQASLHPSRRRSWHPATLGGTRTTDKVRTCDRE